MLPISINESFHIKSLSLASYVGKKKKAYKMYFRTFTKNSPTLEGEGCDLNMNAIHTQNSRHQDSFKLHF